MECLAKQYFAERYSSEVDRLVTLAKDFVLNEPRPHSNLWKEKDAVFKNEGSTIQRLESGRAAIEGGRDKFLCELRLTDVFVFHEIDVLIDVSRNSSISKPRGVTNSAFALAEYVKKSLGTTFSDDEFEKKRKDVKNTMSRNRHFLTLLEKCGPGDLFADHQLTP